MLLLMIGAVAILDKEKNGVRFLGLMLTMTMIKIVQNASTIQHPSATTETMIRAHEMKTTRRSRFPQPHATYKNGSTADIPSRDICIESRRFVKHAIL